MDKHADRILAMEYLIINTTLVTLVTLSPHFQEQVKQLINKTEGLVHGVNHHSLFSANEDLTEIPADHLR